MEIMRQRWEQEGQRQAEEDAAKGIIREPDGPPTLDGEPIQMGTPDDLIGAAIDVSSVTDAKYDALAAHASQMSDSFWLKMTREEFQLAMGTEWFLRVTNPRGIDGIVTDIFAGYRN
jgi:LmbE family N-acetylglucosaminyl deacetylase